MRRAVIAVLGLALLAPACAGGGRGTGEGAPGGKVRVVAGFYPLAEAARRVGGDRVEVTNLTPAGAEPHDLELRSTDIDRIEAAGVVLLLGDFQPALARAARRARGDAIDLQAGPESVFRGAPPGSGRLGDDPHIWLDPTLMARIAERVRDALVRADPAGAGAYRDGAAAYLAALAALDTEMAAGLEGCDRRTIVTSHAAFGYLARRYGLTQDAIAGIDPEAEPDPRRLAQLVAKVRAEGITTIFSETLVSPRVAETLAREAGATTAVLNPIEGLTPAEEAAGEDYASLMRANLRALRQALGCR